MFWVVGIYNLFENGLLNAIRTATAPGEVVLQISKYFTNRNQVYLHQFN